MVMYIGENWVIEAYDIKMKTTKEFVVYNPKDEKILFESNDIEDCIEEASKLKLKQNSRR